MKVEILQQASELHYNIKIIKDHIDRMESINNFDQIDQIIRRFGLDSLPSLESVKKDVKTKLEEKMIAYQNEFNSL